MFAFLCPDGYLEGKFLEIISTTVLFGNEFTFQSSPVTLSNESGIRSVHEALIFIVQCFSPFFYINTPGYITLFHK